MRLAALTSGAMKAEVRSMESRRDKQRKARSKGLQIERCILGYDNDKEMSKGERGWVSERLHGSFQ